MRKTLISAVLVLALAATGLAQTVYQKDRWGEKLYFFEGNTVRLKDRWGDPVLYFDGSTIRLKDRWGEALYYLDGNTLRRKDRWGEKLYYFDFVPTRWQIVCVLAYFV